MHVALLLLALWNSGILLFAFTTIRYDRMIVHVADTAIELHSASSFLWELFHMFADLKLRLGRYKLVIAKFHCFFL